MVVSSWTASARTLSSGDLSQRANRSNFLSASVGIGPEVCAKERYGNARKINQRRETREYFSGFALFIPAQLSPGILPTEGLAVVVRVIPQRRDRNDRPVPETPRLRTASHTRFARAGCRLCGRSPPYPSRRRLPADSRRRGRRF